ncbi:hypothetical protein BDV10DRAFT_199437 [Aspergillus recurvatus]
MLARLKDTAPVKMIDLVALRRQYDGLCKVESSKEEIITKLFEYIKDLEETLQNEKDKVDYQKRAIASYRNETRELEAEKHALIAEKFLEQFIQDGKNGGHDAARALFHAVKQHIAQVDPDASPAISYNIRVCASVAGLTKIYRETGILRPEQDLSAFIRGFNMENPLCDFIDAGLFAEDLNNIHCRRIVFCASADSGYARVLGPHRGSTRISLVEGPPFPREMAELAARFETATFSDVFMSSKLRPPPAITVSFGAQDQDTSIPIATAPTTSIPSSARNYASAAKASAAASSPPAASVTTAATTNANKPKSKPQLLVCLNARNQRVDSPLKISSREAVTAIKRRKFCNQYHILGYCHRMATYGSCTHEHGPELSKLELNDLMYIARFTPCYSGLMCRDIDCISGHRCPYQEYCTHKECRFHKDMHKVDTGIVRTLEV